MNKSAEIYNLKNDVTYLQPKDSWNIALLRHFFKFFKVYPEFLFY